MSEEKPFNCEFLRPTEYIYEPDPRSHAFVRFDHETGKIRPLTPTDYHEAVSHYKLHEGVPEDITIQFETAKNLYLYSWFIYRFYPVVYLQTFSCLELALRTAYEEEIPKNEYYPRSKKPMLRALLRYGIDKGDITNAGFEAWFQRAERNAEHNYKAAKITEMAEKGLESIEIKENDIKVEAQDLEWDYVGQLLDQIPDTRNHYHHGSTTLHNQSLESIQITSEIINQIF